MLSEHSDQLAIPQSLATKRQRVVNYPDPIVGFDFSSVLADILEFYADAGDVQT